MKRISTLLSLIFVLSVGVVAQKAAPVEELKVKQAEFNFGKIPQGRPVTHVFEVTNTSKVPVLIETVQASCGCTTPEWSQDPVAPGATTRIKVGFNAGSEGPFTKDITIIYNNSKTKALVIAGEVFAMPATSAPLNTSLSSIK